MKRTTSSIILTSAILLSGCSTETAKTSQSATEAAANDTVTAAATSETESESNNNEAKGGRLNEPYEISTLENNDVFLTVTNIQVGGDCAFGSYDAGEHANTTNGNTLLQMWVELDVQQLDNPMSGPGVMLENPSSVDADGFTQNADYAFGCNAPTDGTDDWYTVREPGEKGRMYGAFAIPENVTQIKLEGATFDVVSP